MSEDAMTNPDKLLVLCQGCGTVRAGQWSKRYKIERKEKKRRKNNE